MESNINLLPEKDKQLKRDVKTPKNVVEMSTPQDRVFQERVVRMGGVLEFFKTLFKRKPAVLPKTQSTPPPAPPPVAIPAPQPSVPTGPVTRIQTMPEALVPKPPSPPPAAGFLSRIFSAKGKPKLQAPTQSFGVKRSDVVPPPPNSPSVAPAVRKLEAPLPPVPPPPAVRRAAWAPPAPVAGVPVAPLPPTPAPQVRSTPAPPRFTPPVPAGRQPSALSEVSPIVGAGLNVNLVPQEFQPEASVRDRYVAMIAVAAALVLVVGATLALVFYQKSLDQKIADLDAKTRALGQQISALESGPVQQANVLRQRTTDVTKALDQHVYWDNFFTLIEGVTLPTVSYASMSADVSGSVTMAATATSFDEVGKQLLTFQKATNFVTQASILSATKVRSSGGATAPGQTQQASRELVSFSISLRVAPQTFYHSR